MAKGANVVNLFAAKYFPCFGKHNFEQSGRWKNQNFSFRPNYGGAWRTLYVKFRFFKYTTVAYVIICNNLCLFFSNHFQVVKIVPLCSKVQPTFLNIQSQRLFWSVTYLIICNNLCLFFSNYFQVVKIWSNFKVINTNCFKDRRVVSKNILTQSHIHI